MSVSMFARRDILTQPHKRGFAVVMVLSVLAILLLLMASTMSRNSKLQQRTIALVEQQQVQAHLRGAEYWVIEILAEDKRQSDIDELEEPWAQPVPYVPIEGGSIQGQLIDLSGRINVNGLVTTQGVDPIWHALLKSLISQHEGTAQIDDLVDWIDENVDAVAGSLEDSWYVSQQPPYRSASHSLVSVSELHLVRGFDRVLVNALRPSVTALPPQLGVQKININTAGDELVNAILSLVKDPQITADKLIKDRPWNSINDLPWSPLGEDKKPLGALHQGNAKDYLSVTSRVFQLDLSASIGDQSRRQLAIVFRPEDGSQARILQRWALPIE